MKETIEQRSRTMRAVKSFDTAPEMLVRRLTHRMGYRFRLYREDLPGKPDLVFPGKHKVIFVHGCFWHGHNCRRGARIPVRNREYWTGKIARNRMRDKASLLSLQALGWKSLVIWECETKAQGALERRLRRFFGAYC